MSDNHSYHQDNSGVPQYGTDEYNRWYRSKFRPTSLTPPVPPRKPKKEYSAWRILAGFTIGSIVISGVYYLAVLNRHSGSAHPASRNQHIVQPTNRGDNSVDQLPSDTPAPSQTQGADPSALNTPIGGTVELTSTNDPSLDIYVTVNSVSSHRYPADWDSSYMDSSFLPKNGRFLTINVTIDAKSGSYDYNEWDFAVQEADGTQYDVSDGNSGAADFEPELSSGTLDTGQKIRGNISFDVPKTPGAEITLSNAGELLGSWK